MSTQDDTSYKDRLKKRLIDGDVLLILGSGISLQATDRDPCAGWLGLIKSGLEWCDKRPLSALPWVDTTAWLVYMRKLVEKPTSQSLIYAATEIEGILQGPTSGEFGRWIEHAVGRLSVKRPDILEAIGELAQCNVRLATTNYDGLLEHVTGLTPVTWGDHALAERVVRGEDKGILHLHGFWRDPTSLVFSTGSYDRILNDTHTQAILRAIRALKTIVFVGCGCEGLADPNFGRLLDWARVAFKDSQAEHFLICSEKELGELHLRVQDAGILPVVYCKKDQKSDGTGNKEEPQPSKEQNSGAGRPTDSSSKQHTSCYDKLPAFLRALHPRTAVLPFWFSFAPAGSRIRIALPQVLDNGKLANLTSEDDLASVLKDDLRALGYSVAIHRHTLWLDDDQHKEKDDLLLGDNIIVLGDVVNNRLAGKLVWHLRYDEHNDAKQCQTYKDKEASINEFHKLLQHLFPKHDELPRIADEPQPWTDRDGLKMDKDKYYTTWAAVIRAESPYWERQDSTQRRRTCKALLATSDSPAGCYASLCRETQEELQDVLGSFSGEFAAVFHIKVSVARPKEKNNFPGIVKALKLVSLNLPRLSRPGQTEVTRKWKAMNDPIPDANVTPGI